MCDRFPGFLYGGAPVSSWEKRSSMSPIDMAMARGRFSPGFLGWHSNSGGAMDMSGGGSSGSGDSSRTNLIVNYLPQCMAEKDLYALFATVGPIESCRVMKDFKTGYSYGFGFVNYVREEDASAAISSLNGYAVQNKRLKVSYARPSGDDIKETNLYVTNLPRAITEQQLETIFGKYGRIVQKHILRDKNNGMPRGVAFVRFDKREEAQEAISALNNVIPEGGTEPLSVKVAEEHGKQKAAFYAGWTAGFHHNRDDDYQVMDEYPIMAPSPQEMFPPPDMFAPHVPPFGYPPRLLPRNGPPMQSFPMGKRLYRDGGMARKPYFQPPPFKKPKMGDMQLREPFRGRKFFF